MVGIAAALGLAVLALEGGEYGTRDLVELKRRTREAHERIAELRHEVDSLSRLDRALRTDPVTQERVARELYGMIRQGETLYQVVPRDSSRRP